jgi:hypothetical protein
MIKLLVKFADESHEVECHESDISIGRSADNVLSLADKKSSRKHAKIVKVGDEYRINDLGSGNGTKVNGNDVNTHVLAKGDEIAIGLTTIFVLTLDTPAKPAAVAAPPAAVAAPRVEAASPAPAPRAAEERPAEPMGEARRKQTRRAVARHSSNWAGTAASILVIGGLAAGGWYFYQQHEKDRVAKADARSAQEKQASAAVREAEAEYNKFRARTETDLVEDSLIAEATTLDEKYGAQYPQFSTLVSQLKQRRSEQIGKMTFADVDTRVQNALRERRFNDALDALKNLKNGADPSSSGNLIAKVSDAINNEFKSIDEYGRKLSEEKKYTIAADHYRLQAPKFKGTEHYRYLMYKPETLEQLKKAEAETATAKANRPGEPAPKPAEPEKPAETAIAKAEPVMPKEPPKPAPAAMPAPAPAMPKDPPKPPPAMPKEPPKPAPKEPPKPAMPKEPEEKKEEGAGKVTTMKKPDVLCDCKKIIKGVFCVKCDRLLATEDMRNGLCKRCEEKPKKIDMCVKKYFMVDGQPDKKSEKPILLDGKLYDFPYEDKARIVYMCEGCQVAGDSASEIKHKDDCATKNVIKVCSKSGSPPHGGEKK